MSKYIVESKKFENESLAMLTKAGLGDNAEAVRNALNNMTVNGYDDGTKVVALSRTGKELIPLTKWFCSTWNNGDDIEHTLEAVADQVHRMYRMPTTKNADLVKVQAEYPTIDKLTAWLDNEAQNAKNKGSELRAKGQYDFPKEMLAYSDDMVDCYRANTPAEAMALGDGYPFCISRRDGSNFFYSYRTRPTTTTVYFCWFKDEQGRKNHDDMVVVHVGDDGKYMVTKSGNGSFPRDSKAVTIKKYPRLKGAIESGKLTVIPMSDMEKEVREKYNARSYVGLRHIEGKSPEYIELMLSQGVKLDNNAFDYIFEKVDNGDLKRGNNGNSLTKKYIETGIHELTEHQKQVLIDSGNENEIYRSVKIWWRGRLEAGRVVREMEPEEVKFFVEHGDLDSDDSIILRYLRYNTATNDIKEALKDLPEKQKLQVRAAITYNCLFETYTPENTDVIVEEGKIILRGDNNHLTIRYYEPVIYIDRIEGIKEVEFIYINFKKVLEYRKKLPEFSDGAMVEFERCENIDLSLLGDVRFERISIHFGGMKGGSASAVSSKRYSLNGVSINDGVINFPKGVESVILRNIYPGSDIKVNWPDRLINLDISHTGMLYQKTGFEGITREITGVLNFGTEEHPLELKGFPKKINRLVLDSIGWDDEVPKLMLDSEINNISVEREDVFFTRSIGRLRDMEENTVVRQWILNHQGTVKLESKKAKGVSSDKIKVEDKGNYYDIETKEDDFGLSNMPDKPIHNFRYNLDSDWIEWANNPISGAQHQGCEYNLGNIVDLDALPYQFETNFNWVIIKVWDTLRDTLKLTHQVKGASYLLITRSNCLKRVEGLENIKGLYKVLITGCPNLDLDSIKVAEGVVLDTVYASQPESLQVGHLGRVLGALDEDDIGMAVPATTGTAVGNGTVADAGKVPTPSMGLIKADWFKDKKKRKGLRALMSSLNKLS